MRLWIRAALAGAAAFTLANMVSNLLFFRLGRELLFEAPHQSEKIVAVMFEMEPLPLMFTNGPLYLAIAAAIGALHGLIFLWLAPVLGTTRLARGLGFAVVTWVLLALYFEFHTPFNMFGEPPSLVAMELAFWAVVLTVHGLALSFLAGRGAGRQALTF
ncbi:MAG: hypothetical protein RIG84_06165 [Roseovarius sp.]